MHLIPQSWAHWHILLGVVPMVGFVFLLGFHATAMATGNALMQRCCLAVFIILALVAIPIYASGDGSAAALSGNPRLAAGLARWPPGLGTSGARRPGGNRNCRRDRSCGAVGAKGFPAPGWGLFSASPC